MTTAPTPTDAAVPAAAAGDDVLATLQRAYDLVKADVPHTLRRSDDITEDLELDSLEFIDLVSVLEEELSPEVVEQVIDRVPDLRTVGDLVDVVVELA